MSNLFNVLFLEDDAIFRAYMCKSFAEAGIGCVAVGTAEEAINAFLDVSHQFSLALLDLNVNYSSSVVFKDKRETPGGLEVAKRITSDIPVVFFTGAQKNEIEELRKLKYIDGVLEKSLITGWPQIERVIRRICNARERIRSELVQSTPVIEEVIGRIMARSSGRFLERHAREAVVRMAQENHLSQVDLCREIILGECLFGDLIHYANKRITAGQLKYSALMDSKKNHPKRRR